MIEVGTLDRVTALIGERGMGKSTLAWLDAKDFRRETGGLVIGHSPNGQIGRRPEIAFHDDLRSLQRGLRRKPGLFHFVTTGPAEDVIDFGERLAGAIRKQAFRRAHPFERYREHRPPPSGLQAAPVLVVIDEGVGMKRHPTQRELEELEKLLTSARHKHFALTWSSQAPSARQWVLMEQANRHRIFRYVHEWGGNAIRAAGIPQDAVQAIKTLPKFVYYSKNKADLDSGRFVALPPP